MNTESQTFIAGQQYLDRFTENPKIERKSKHSKNLKYKFFKNGTLRVSCKGSKHLVWERDVKPERIGKCLDRFCWDCELNIFL